MKKSKILVLLLVILLVFTSCITKKDIQEKELIKKEAEEEIKSLQDEYSLLDEEYKQLSSNLDEINTSNDELSGKNDETASKIESLKNEVPNPPFQFLIDEYIDNLIIAIDDSHKASAFKRVLKNDEPEKIRMRKNKLKYVYELKGDRDSDRYVTVTITTGDDFSEVYDIIAEYSSEVYEDDYNELIDVLIASIVMITEDPYNYEREYLDAAEDILEEGNYFNKCIYVEQDTDGDKVTTKLYCRNY